MPDCRRRIAERAPRGRFLGYRRSERRVPSIGQPASKSKHSFAARGHDGPTARLTPKLIDTPPGLLTGRFGGIPPNELPFGIHLPLIFARTVFAVIANSRRMTNEIFSSPGMHSCVYSAGDHIGCRELTRPRLTLRRRRSERPVIWARSRIVLACANGDTQSHENPKRENQPYGLT